MMSRECAMGRTRVVVLGRGMLPHSCCVLLFIPFLMLFSCSALTRPAPWIPCLACQDLAGSACLVEQFEYKAWF